MPKTRLTNEKRKSILKDVMERLDVGELRADAVAKIGPAYKAVQAAVDRACPPKHIKVLKQYSCTKSSQSPTVRTEGGMQRSVNFWEKGGRMLQGKKQLSAFRGPNRWQFFEYDIKVTDKEMDLVESYKLAKDVWEKARSAARADFNAVIQSAKNVEDLEEVLPLDESYFRKYKKANQALTVAGDVVARVKSAKLDPAS